MLEIIFLLLKIFLFLTLLIAIFHVFATHLIMYYETRLHMMQNDQPLTYPWPLVIKSFFIEIFCNFIRFFLLPFANINYKNASFKSQKSIPILLVHGFLQNQTDWLWFRRQLLKRKMGPVYSLNLQTHFDSIATLASVLQTKIAEIKTETGCDQIVLIGHSMGGLICGYYNEFLAQDNEVLMSVSLGSPFQGTRLAALGQGNSKEMMPGSPFLQNLSECIRSSSKKYFYIASKIDNLIVPWQSAVPNFTLENSSSTDSINALNTLILEDYGHLRFLISTKVIDQIVQWVQQEKFNENASEILHAAIKSDPN